MSWARLAYPFLKACEERGLHFLSMEWDVMGCDRCCPGAWLLFWGLLTSHLVSPGLNGLGCDMGSRSRVCS